MLRDLARRTRFPWRSSCRRGPTTRVSCSSCSRGRWSGERGARDQVQPVAVTAIVKALTGIAAAERVDLPADVIRGSPTPPTVTFAAVHALEFYCNGQRRVPGTKPVRPGKREADVQGPRQSPAGAAADGAAAGAAAGAPLGGRNAGIGLFDALGRC